MGIVHFFRSESPSSLISERSRPRAGHGPGPGALTRSQWPGSVRTSPKNPSEESMYERRIPLLSYAHDHRADFHIIFQGKISDELF
jgi:hypothetical protein